MTSSLYDNLGPRGRRRVRWLTVLGVAIILGLIALVLDRLGRAGMLSWSVWSILGRADLQLSMLRSLQYTVTAAASAMGFSLALGVVIGALRLSANRTASTVGRVYVELFRGLPPLLIIFFAYLGIPLIGIDISTFWSLVLGLALYNGAVIGEIIRAGVQGLPRGQAEAGRAIGLSKVQLGTLILLPQALRNMVPALVNEVVTILKETSLGFIIGYGELIRGSQIIIEYLGGEYALPVYVETAAIYIGLCLALSAIATWLARRDGRDLNASTTQLVPSE